MAVPVSKPWFDPAAWRIEISPRAARIEDEFLVALSPSLGVDRSGEITLLEPLKGTVAGLVSPQRVVIFTGQKRLGRVTFSIPGHQTQLLLVGVLAGDHYALSSAGTKMDYKVQRSGIIEMALPPSVDGGAMVTVQQQ